MESFKEPRKGIFFCCQGIKQIEKLMECPNAVCYINAAFVTRQNAFGRGKAKMLLQSISQKFFISPDSAIIIISFKDIKQMNLAFVKEFASDFGLGGSFYRMRNRFAFIDIIPSAHAYFMRYMMS